MRKFFRGLLVSFLIVVIVGGIGFIGYNYIDLNRLGLMITNDSNITSENTTSSQQNAQQNDSSQHGNMQQPVSTIGSEQLNVILKNKEKLDDIRTSLDEALKYLTLDPYASSNNQSQTDMDMQSDTQMTMGNMQQGDQMTMGSTLQDPNFDKNQQPSQQANQQGLDLMTATMQDMGSAYDTGKMEQLHAGLFDLAVGMEILEQLSNEYIEQAESVNVNTQDPILYYSNQYKLTVHNKTSLNQAMGYLEKAADLVNINPYISSDGYIYDKDRMEQIHQSVFKLAESVASINLLNNDLNDQSIYLVNAVQVYTNNVNAMNTMNMTSVTDSTNSANTSITDSANAQVNHSTAPTGFLSGTFDNINITSVVNTILIIFVIGLILGILGFIMSLFKTPKVQSNQNQNHEEIR